MSYKPPTAEDYDAEDTRQVISTCLTFAGALGDMVDEHYKEISDRLRGKGFEPDRKGSGEPTRQRWRWHAQKVTIDFLMPPAPGVDPDKVRLQSLESDFAALIVKPLGLAFHERIWRDLKGDTLEGDQLERRVAFCGPAAFVALKAFAFSKRTERKDAYDLVYVLRRWPHGLTDIADRMATHARRDPDLVYEILELLEQDFGTKASSGPRSASRFYDGRVDDTRVMDAHGAVDDFLQACARRGVEWQRPG